MGRSKFPGKPSKSINRKRISVLQVENEQSAATAKEKKEEEDVPAPTATSGISKPNDKNGRDDDEDGNSGCGQAKSSGACSGNGNGTSTENNSNGNKKVNTNTSDNNSNGQKSGGDKDKNEKTSTATASNDVNNSSKDDHKKPTISNSTENKVEKDEEKDKNYQSDASEDVDDEDDEKQEPDNSVDEKTTAHKSKCGNKKFQNLNLSKPEIMLPSSKQKVEQLSDENASSSTVSTNNPFAMQTEIDTKTKNEKSTKNVDFPVASETKLNPTATDTKINLTAGTTPPASSINTNKNNEATTSNTTTATATTTGSTTSTGVTSKPKKSVTFKNILETSDDKCAVKKIYNPNNRIPLVSIMKKECMNRSYAYSRSNESIVRPSRLTEILKNKNNIDKLNSLKFRSSLVSPSSPSSSQSSTQLSMSLSSVSMHPFGISALSRAFGAPTDDEVNKEDSSVRFRETVENHSDVESSCTDSDTDVPDMSAERSNPITKQDTTVAAESDCNDDDNDDDDDDQQMIVHKHFVLPKRSTRSSRVIKPNKRFVEDGIICRKRALSSASKSKTVSSSSSTTTSASASPSTTVVNTTTTATTTSTSATTQHQTLLAPKKESTSTTIPIKNNYFGLGNYNEANSAVDGIKLLTSSKDNFSEVKPNLSVLTTALNKTLSTSSTSPCSSVFGSSTFSSLKTNSSFVLRQPRLQFESLNERINNPLLKINTTAIVASKNNGNLTTSLTSPKPIFTSPTLAGVNSAQQTPNNMNCVVCENTLHSKNVQQARKYGALACAICRKYISKITKKSIAASASPSSKPLQLQCKSDGICCIQPSAKSHSKNFKKVYKERCSACWLTKCLQTLQFPSGHKQRLNSVLEAVDKLKQQINGDSKRLIALSTPESLTTALSQTAESQQSSLANLKKEPGLLSPSGTTTSRINWKPTDGLTLNIKSNPLAENNGTFGSTPLLRPAMLEKPIFSTNSISSNSNSITGAASVSGEKPQTVENAALPDIPHESVDKSTSKTKRKTKEKEKMKELQKTTVQESVDTAHESADPTNLASPLSSNNNYTSNNSTCTTIATGNVTTTTTTQPVTTLSTGAGTSAENSKRQRIDLKGPRVKHVCRSASIVLGQPLAMFGEEDSLAEDETCSESVSNNDEAVKTIKPTAEETSNEMATISTPAPIPTATATPTNKLEKTAIKIVIDENDNCSSCKPKELNETIQENERENDSIATTKLVPVTTATAAAVTTGKIEKYAQNKNVKITTTKPTRPALQSVGRNIKGYNINTTTTQIGKKYMRNLQYNNNFENVLQQQSRRKDASSVAALALAANNTKSKSLISIDFWENYDPAEVCQTGFGLIITEPVAQRALCFLCGSCGLDPLIFCACCCEPYHQYCVLDEYNIKHSSLDDTMASILFDNSALVGNTENAGLQLTQRLNWLCPRCTVCYTCNMSSGSKVKCQKCQKNYHTTCLGTSKRLLGADRPLICVNCLKCKSCATTKVSKFVGNLPMCTSCFKLRKRGNYCPICQKCYDDNDFDLKMMECGDCNQWVHSKCEGLSDEQYNLLSTLPETIEFICKKCARSNEHSKQRANEWRQMVMEEFKTSLFSVLKLLSKSRQACALLKLSPRKKINCTCGALTNRSNGRIHPKTLLFSSGEREQLGSDGESQCSEDIYEFSECQTGSQLNSVSEKLKASNGNKCTCGYNALKGTANGSSNNGSLNSYYNSSTQQTTLLSLVEIKKKISNNLYTSLPEFNYDMNNVIQMANCDELIIAYKEILSEQFPWFQNETKACTDALEEDMFESCSSYAINGVSGPSLDGGCAAADINYGTTAVDDSGNTGGIENLPLDVEDIVFSHKTRDDARICLFCRKTGEGVSNEESRLLYCGHDCWVHTNCAMWSAEVFEEIDGSLQNVHSAVSRGRMIKCTVCGNRGASVGCNIKSCGEHYHYPCARSIDCAFMTDKTIYCPTHARDGLSNSTSKNVSIETNFEVTRPVYVELDRKRKKLIDPSRVQFHIGSLEVRELGTVFPRFSDSFEAIVPINFLCSRLYWSYKEPWKIVEYTVRTIIQNSYSTLNTLDMGRNFTVDHSNPNFSVVQLGLTQIARWHNSLSLGELIDKDSSSGNDCFAGRSGSTFTKYLPEYLPHNQNSLLIPNNDENTEEEPQTNADLLPPDLKDAIFEDLPHELLDGISMLDIFPKFMNYEELGNGGDCKSEAFLNDQSKDGVSIATTTTTAGTTASTNISDNDDTMNSAFSKQLELSNSWSSSSTTNSTSVNHVEDAMLGAARSQFKRSLSVDCYKTENFLRRVGNSSITAAALKRRKLSKSNAETVMLSLSQQRGVKKDAITAAIARRQSQCSESDFLVNQRTKSFQWSAAKRYMDPSIENETTKIDVSGIKLMQVDGVDDSITEYRIINAEAQLNGTVKCERCRCTYRNYDSFQRHLGNCEPLSTSESDSDRAPSRSPSDSITCSINGATIINSDGFQNDLNKLSRNGTLSSTTSSSTSANLPFIQAFQQATTAGIPLNSIQTSANLGGIPIANIQGLQTATPNGVQTLQNLQGLQNLQSLQNLQFQNFQPQTIGGGNFFISQAAPAAQSNNGSVGGNTDELQFFSNALHNLTANLNGTYTLAPTTTGPTGFTVQPQAAAQPQLIALSTNPDGTQQIIQLPTATATTTVNPQIIQATANGFQTLQAPSADKKFVLPIASKSMGNKMGSKISSLTSNGGKQKFKASNTVKPIQSKGNAAGSAAATVQTPQITVLNTSNGVNNNNGAQLLNSNILQQLQAAANAQQQPLLFQTGGNTQQHQIIMQQPQHNIISFVTTDGAPNSQVQYVSIPTNDYKAQPTASYISAAGPATANATTNSLLQGATYLQTDASGNLVLTTAPNTNANGHLQMLSAAPLNQSPQVIGTLIQPQTLQLNGNVLTTGSGDSQQSVIIGGTSAGTGGNGLEMIAAANAAANTPQVILAAQPMYYGLETIVQNTVMSSQQFVSTGVLSQNASFSATTTQVFQASKIEPLVDIPTGYVVLNNVESTPSSATAQQQSQTHGFLNAGNIVQQNGESQQSGNMETIYRLQQQTQTMNESPKPATTYQFASALPFQQHQSQPQIVTAKIQPVVTQLKQRTNNLNATKSLNSVTTTKSQPQIVNKVFPTSLAQQQSQNKKQNAKLFTQQQQQQSQANVYVRCSTASANIPTSIATVVEQQPVQHIYMTQANPVSAVTVNETNVIGQQPQQQIYTTVQPMTATISLTTTKQPVNTTASKPLTQIVNTRKTNPIRPIHKIEVKPKILKTNSNVIATTSTATTNLLPSTTNVNSITTTPMSTIQLKPHENNKTAQQFTTATLQPTQHYNLITIAKPNAATDQQQHQQQTFIYEQQQVNEHESNDRIQQCNGNESYQQHDLLANQSGLNMNINNCNGSNNNSSNRLQFSSIYNSNVPTNIVNPIQLTNSTCSQNMHPSTASTTLVSRPTNRVLPMQQKQQQDYDKTENVSCNISNNSNNKVQQQQPILTQKCFASPTSNLKTCFETEIIEKDEQPLTENYIQENETEQLQTAHDTIQVHQVHVQEEQHGEEGEHNITFSVGEIKNGELGLVEIQHGVSQRLNNVVDNLQVYENAINNVNNGDCMLNEKQQEKLIAAGDEAMSGIENGRHCLEHEDVDDGFNLKMTTDDDDGMGLDQEISDTDEPAVKEKISRILDNLTNDDCADSVATATTVEAGAAIDMQRIQFMQTDICESSANSNRVAKIECGKDELLKSSTNIENNPSSFIEPITADTLKKFDEENSLQTQTHIETELKKSLENGKNVSKEINPMEITTTPPIARTMHTHPPFHVTRDQNKITGPHLLYEIQSEDGFTYKSTSISEIWEKVFEAVQVARRAHGLIPLPEGPLADMSGVQMIGLKTNALKYLIEQLPGVEKCGKYTPKYHKRSNITSSNSSLVSSIGSSTANAMIASSCDAGNSSSTLDYSSDHDELQENPFESARCEPYGERSEYDMFSWLASRHRKQPIQVFVQPSDSEIVARRGTGSNLPMAMKYRTLKETYKDYVGVFRSHIHGRGLYCTKDIEAGEMVIEYAGELIRSTLTDKRERNYNSRGIGCYMFKIDDNLVVDATMRGNAARFINHSCEPNCYSKVVDILGHKHIIIFALRRIVQGEELTYDYKFPFEEEKIPCSCGSKKCRKYLN